MGTEVGVLSLSVVLACFLPTVGALRAATPDAIVALNTRAMVYLQVEDAQGQFVDSGSGFVVSHDGFVVTAAHVKAEAGQTMWATIGQRTGTRYPLDPRDTDEPGDTALWQLPQSASCRYSVTLSSSVPKTLDRLLVLGFPGKDGLTAALVNISNPSSPAGWIKADGFLRSGYSGAPAFNEAGNVVALVHSGAPAGGNNDLIPISFALNLARKRAVKAGVDAPVAFEDSCYSSCRSPSHGVEAWASQLPWSDDSGDVDGGHNPTSECAGLVARAQISHPGAEVILDPGEGTENVSGKWEKSRKDILGHVTYKYFCKGTIRSGPTYALKQSPACPLWN